MADWDDAFVPTADDLITEVLHGTRMTAEEFLTLPESKSHYELIDGVVLLWPRPSVIHQEVSLEVLCQLSNYLHGKSIGEVLPSVDVMLGPGPLESHVVYRPDIVYLWAADIPRGWDRVRAVPPLIVEITSAATRNRDTRTKFGDYERAGVREYWIMDPERKCTRFYRIQDGKYVEIPCSGGTFASEAVLGFRLDVTRLRGMFAELPASGPG